MRLVKKGGAVGAEVRDVWAGWTGPPRLLYGLGFDLSDTGATGEFLFFFGYVGSSLCLRCGMRDPC